MSLIAEKLEAAAVSVEEITGVWPMRYHQSAGSTLRCRLLELEADLEAYRVATESAYSRAERVIRVAQR